MKRAFVRAVWGNYDDSHRITRRRGMIDDWVGFTRDNPYVSDFITYVFGKKNFDILGEAGINCVLIDDEPLVFDATREQYRHKLEVFRYAMEDDGIDEMVFLDWDVVPTKRLPCDFWERSREKSTIQACLQQYRRPKCPWRVNGDIRKVANGGFVYMADKSMPSRIIKNWNDIKGNSMEPPVSKLIDEMSGGWKGIDHYWQNFEAEFCVIHHFSVFPNVDRYAKDECFVHFQGGRDKSILLSKAKSHLDRCIKKERGCL